MVEDIIILYFYMAFTFTLEQKLLIIYLTKHENMKFPITQIVVQI